MTQDEGACLRPVSVLYYIKGDSSLLKDIVLECYTFSAVAGETGCNHTR
jgi:hypothetical protein